MKNYDNLDNELNNLREQLRPLNESLHTPDQLNFNNLSNESAHVGDTHVKTRTPKRVVYKRVAAIACMIVFVLGISLSMPGVSSLFGSIRTVKPTDTISAVYSPSKNTTSLVPTAKSYEEIYNLLYEKYDSQGYFDIGNSIIEDSTAENVKSSQNIYFDTARNFSFTTGAAKDVGFGSTNSLEGDFSGTNLQVSGVDEADIVKSDGKYIYIVNSDGVHIVETTADGQSKLVATISNPKYDPDDASENYKYRSANNIYIASNKLIVIYSSFSPSTLYRSMLSSTYDCYFSMSGGTSVDIYDVTNPADPQFERTFSQDGSIVSTRMIGSTLYIISNHYIDTKSIENYHTMVPNVSDTCYNNGETLPLDYACINILPEFEATSYLVTTSLDITGVQPAETNALLGAGNTVYSSADNLYVVSQKWTNEADQIAKYRNYLPENAVIDKDRGYDGINTSEIIKYSLANNKITLIAKGEVPGYTYDQYTMDEHNGYFRIAVNNGYLDENDKYVNMASLFILDSDLNITGQLVDMAHDEEIKSVRFMGDKIYLVTFKQVDPLFVIDASNPSNPTVLGELKIPGFSEYLHPYSENLLIGVGYNTKTDYYEWYDESQKKTVREEFEKTDGIKLSLFDISNPLNPIEVDTYSLESGTESNVMYDPKAFLFSKRNNLIGFPVENYEKEDLYYYIVNVDESGFSYRGRISNMTDANTDNAWYYSIQRGLYIGDVLYTVSQANIAATDMNSLSRIGTTDLPFDFADGNDPVPLSEDVKVVTAATAD